MEAKARRNHLPHRWRVGVCCVGHGLRECSTIIPAKLDSGSETLRKRRGLTARFEHSDDPVHLRLAGKKPFHRHLHPLEFEFSGQVIQAADCVASHLLANVGSAQLLPTEARELCPPFALAFAFAAIFDFGAISTLAQTTGKNTQCAKHKSNSYLSQAHT